MATSKVSAEERLLRKRQAARIRQQRCRARKRQAMLERHGKEKSEQVTQSGHVTVTASENQHPNHSSRRTPPAQYVRAQSPRSVYWKEATAWAHAEANQRLVERRMAERQQPWSSPHMETRYDVSTVDYHPVYSRRYQASPPLPPPRTVPRLIPAIRHPPARFYVERGPRFAVQRKLPEYYRRPEAEYRQAPKAWMTKLQAPPQKPVVVQKTVVPPKPVPSKPADPIKSKEEAAIDAILSLKSEVVSPPSIKRVVPEDKSAFQRLNQLREVRTGLYTMMRN